MPVDSVDNLLLFWVIHNMFSYFLSSVPIYSGKGLLTGRMI